MEETNFPIRPEHSLVDDTRALAGSMMAYPIVNMDTYVRHSVALLATHLAHPMYQPAAFSYLYSLAQNPVDVLGSVISPSDSLSLMVVLRGGFEGTSSFQLCRPSQAANKQSIHPSTRPHHPHP